MNKFSHLIQMLLSFTCTLVVGYLVVGLTEFIISSAATIGAVLFEIVRIVGWVAGKIRGNDTDEREDISSDEEKSIYSEDTESKKD